MKFTSILDSIHCLSVTGSTDDVEIDSVCFDSRKADSGSVFCALPGVQVDGNKFVSKAIESGARAIISEQSYPADNDAVWVQVKDAREAMGIAAANLYGRPALEMPVIGVTGTNGKTTTALLVHHLMQSALHRAGMIGTIQYVIGDRSEEAPHTTPESPELQRLLREMRDEDCRAAVMEVSSHGLSQHRSTGVHFDVGIFTNLSQDHLDYHGNMENYFQAKKLLLDRMDSDPRKKGTMVVNKDDSYGARLLKSTGISKVEMVSFGRSVTCDYRASNIQSDFNGTKFTLTVKGGRQILVKTPLIGGFNVYNTLAALAAAKGIKLNLREAVRNLENCPQVPGRLESVVERQINYRCYVDYAHTPDALINAQATLRELNPNRLITVFGCGGDRDQTKRAPMAAAAESGSDIVILTSDNPRTEDPKQILADAEKGFKGRDFKSILDRREAIREAINMAGERDIVLIAGKGHETYQEIDGVKHDFDDRLEARNAIAFKAESFEEDEELEDEL